MDICLRHLDLVRIAIWSLGFLGEKRGVWGFFHIDISFFSPLSRKWKVGAGHGEMQDTPKWCEVGVAVASKKEEISKRTVENNLIILYLFSSMWSLYLGKYIQHRNSNGYLLKR